MRLASCKGAVDRAAAEKLPVKMLWNVQYESFNRHSRENENWERIGLPREAVVGASLNGQVQTLQWQEAILWIRYKCA